MSLCKLEIGKVKRWVLLGAVVMLSASWSGVGGESDRAFGETELSFIFFFSGMELRSYQEVSIVRCWALRAALSSFASPVQIDPGALARLLRAGGADPKMVIIDVRDDDVIGGSVVSSINVPAATFSRHIPELVSKYKDYGTLLLSLFSSKPHTFGTKAM